MFRGKGTYAHTYSTSILKATAIADLAALPTLLESLVLDGRQSSLTWQIPRGSLLIGDITAAINQLHRRGGNYTQGKYEALNRFSGSSSAASTERNAILLLDCTALDKSRSATIPFYGGKKDASSVTLHSNIANSRISSNRFAQGCSNINGTYFVYDEFISDEG